MLFSYIILLASEVSDTETHCTLVRVSDSFSALLTSPGTFLLLCLDVERYCIAPNACGMHVRNFQNYLVLRLTAAVWLLCRVWPWAAVRGGLRMEGMQMYCCKAAWILCWLIVGGQGAGRSDKQPIKPCGVMRSYRGEFASFLLRAWLQLMEIKWLKCSLT